MFQNVPPEKDGQAARYTPETGRNIVRFHDHGDENARRLSFAEIAARLGLGSGAAGRMKASRWYKKAKAEMTADLARVQRCKDVADLPPDALAGAVTLVDSLRVVDEEIERLLEDLKSARTAGDAIAVAAYSRILKDWVQLRARIEPREEGDEDFGELVRVMWEAMSEVPAEWRRHVFDKVVERFGEGLRRLYVVGE